MPQEVFGDPTTEIVIDGTPYTFSELRMGGHGQLQAFLNKLPAPAVPRQDVSGIVDALTPSPDVLDGLDSETKAKLIEGAIQSANRMVASQMREARAEAASWPPQVFSGAGLQALTTAEGGPAEFLHVMLRQHHPEVTRQKARDMVAGMKLVEFMKIFEVAFPPQENAPDPKAQPPDPAKSPSGGSGIGSS